MNQEKRYPTALTIAGSDSGGGAGIQADLKTFSAIGVFGASVITAITAQNTREVRAVEVLPPALIRLQLEAVLDDIAVDVVKTGMLPDVPAIEQVASVIDRYGLKEVVVDPVMVATSGARLSSAATAGAFRELLYARLSLLTPNVPETEALTGIPIGGEKEMYKAGELLLRQGCRAVLIKGGHLKGERASDTLFSDNRPPVVFSSEYVETWNLHGTGCTLASAIAAYRALGREWEEAVGLAKTYIAQAIRAGVGVCTGRGHGPVNHFFHPEVLQPK
ncbi:MAG: bifunctional hydroxymethylpyrimidine kinase/phosphomethylpyrimidine kinase [Culturomica sp.]|jgi:hydroxymethylpyrimidine/phosphomethylpyrimidine kinase|nr:bifunctional hydroxymethylpyrimidine kinase/phosphomethylpyrimidine kinase [Culturomica sp.]